MPTKDRPSARIQARDRRPTGPQLFRLNIMRRWLIERRRWNANDAMEEFQVSRRTVIDDVEWLRQFGFEIGYNAKTRSYELKEESGDLVSLQLRESEWAAIVLAQEILEKLGAERSAEAIAKIGARVTELMPQLLGADPSTFGPALSMVRGPSPDEPLPHLEPLQEAIKDQLAIRIRYYTLYRNETSERMVDPYRLVSREGRGYLVGYCHTRGRVIIFRLDRIRELSVSDDVFLIDNDFDLENCRRPDLFCRIPESVAFWRPPAVLRYAQLFFLCRNYDRWEVAPCSLPCLGLWLSFRGAWLLPSFAGLSFVDWQLRRHLWALPHYFSWE